MIPTSVFTADIAAQKFSIVNPFATNADATTYPAWISNHLDIYPEVDCSLPGNNTYF